MQQRPAAVAVAAAAFSAAAVALSRRPIAMAPTNAAPEAARLLNAGEAGETVVIASYPRSGNTMLRKLIESVTGVRTGSDSRPSRPMARDLMLYGLEGEGNIGEHQNGGQVWLVKTHFPERQGWKELGAQRAILLVRNPFNAISSYFNMLLTGTHTHSIHTSEYERFASVWDSHVREEIDMWCAYHRWWLQQPIPLLVVRYEELVATRPQARERELRRICEFLYGPTHTRTRLGGSSNTAAAKAGISESQVEDTPMEEIEARLCATLQPSVDDPVDVAYEPRTAAVSADLSFYTQEQQDYVVNTAASLLTELGYADLRCSEGLPSCTPPSASSPPLISRKDGGLECPVVWCNREKSSLRQTESDLAGRGFNWKWDLRKTVRVAAKSSTVEQPSRDVLNQEQIRLFEDDVVTKVHADRASRK